MEQFQNSEGKKGFLLFPYLLCCALSLLTPAEPCWRLQCVEVEPGNPHLFWSASEDGTVRQFDTRLRWVV